MTAYSDNTRTSIRPAFANEKCRPPADNRPCLETRRSLGRRRALPAIGVLAIGCLVTVFAASPASADSQPTTRPATQKSDLQAIAPPSRITRATLNNGLNVVVVPNHLAPAVTTVMTYNVGARQAPKDFPGRAHALEHMLFRGTNSLTGTQISAIAAALGGSFNASTAIEATQYYFTVPAEYLKVVLRLQAERMESAAITSSDWAKERGAIKKEVGSSYSNPGYIAYKKMRQQLFRGTPYSHGALGTKPSFDKTTADDLRGFYDQWYTPNNATLVVAGDVKPRRVIDAVKRFFGDIPRSQLPERSTIELAPVDADPVRVSTNRGVGTLYLAYRAPGSNRIDRFATLKVLATILGEPRGRLYTELVTNGPALSASFSTQTMREAGIAFVAASFPKNTDSQALLERMREVLAQIVEQGVTEQQVVAAKRQLATTAAAASDSIPGQAHRWARAVAERQYQSPGALLKRVMAVDVEDVNQLAQSILRGNEPVRVTLTPGDSNKATAANNDAKRSDDDDEYFTPENVSDVSLPAWAAKPLQSIKVPKRKIHPETTVLDNGLKLITVSTEAVQAVHVYGHILNNPALETPPGKAGVARVLSRLLTYGTDKRDRRAFEAAVNKIGASLSAGTSFSLTALPRYFQRGLALLAEKQRHPALPEEYFPQVKRQVAAAVAGQIQSPDFLAGQALNKGLYPKSDPTLRHPTPETVMSLTHEDVVAYYRKVFEPQLTTMVVVSSLSADTVKQAVKKQFGGWANDEGRPELTLGPVPPNESHRFYVTDDTRKQAAVTMAQTLDVADNLRDYRALQLGTQILTGGFYASLLYGELRAERGLVYYVTSNVGLSRQRGRLSFGFGAPPTHVEQAAAIIRQTISQIATNPVSDKRLHRARAGLIRQIPLQIASADAIGSGLLRRTRLNLPLDAPYRAARRYLDISAREITQVFAEYARPKELVRVVQGPPKD